jgi:hypothetical protein
MKKNAKRKVLILLSIGMLTISATQIISQYIKLNDLAKGSFIGIGIGLLITSLIFGNLKTLRN